MTQQTLREEWRKKFVLSIEGHRDNLVLMDSLNEIPDFFLAHFKEFAEKELIGEDEEHHYLCGKGGHCNCGANVRNALRNEQREILAEKLK